MAEGWMDMMWNTRVTLTHSEIMNIRCAMEDVLDRKKELEKAFPEDAGYAEDIQKLESLLRKLKKASLRSLGIRNSDRSPRGQGTGRT